MREIRFRAWDSRAGKMWNPIIRPDGVLMAENGMGGYVSYYDQDPQDPIMQFTGLKDKNGVDIYEGDILCSHLAQNEIKGVMEWDEDRAGWSNFKPLNRFHVMGNIHENPELLEKES